MKILHSTKAARIRPDTQIVDLVTSRVSEHFLREVVETLSVPRHFFANAQRNQLTEEWLCAQFRSYGYHVFRQGKYDNVVALPSEDTRGKVLLAGAHYDSVPWSAGADDNASAIAALLACAKTIVQHFPQAPVCFVTFNREEDWMIGSDDFVKNYLLTSGLEPHVVHILEMVGYCSHRPHSQRSPRGLPIAVPDIGNFLGIIGNTRSNAFLARLLQHANSYLPELPVLGLQIYWGLEKCFYHLLRSDHAAFWKKNIPALMWTDTAYCRNPNYHRASDTPDTLDYEFLRKVTQLLIVSMLNSW